jgi:surface protein
MPTTNGLNQFLVPAQDAFLYQLFYNKVYGGNTGCTVVINGATVQMGANSSIDILVETISGGTGCLLSGDRPDVYGGDSNQYKYVPQTFVSVWDTTRTSSGSSTATQVKLPLISTGTYNFIVDWGDGSTDRITTWNQAQTTHTYAIAGAYQVIITGTIQGFRFANTGDRLKILSIFKWGVGFRLGATDSHFQGCANLDLSVVEDILDLTGLTTFANIFRGCTRLSLVNNINSWNTSNITSLESTFMDSPNFNTYIGDWDTSNVNTMLNCFNMATANALVGNFNQDISKWNTSKVTTMASMFFNSLNFIVDKFFSLLKFLSIKDFNLSLLKF